MRTFGHTLGTLGIIGAALAAPAYYLHLRAGGDPQGIVDGLLRLSWWVPVLWPVGVYFESERRMARAKGLLKLQAPLLFFLVLASTFGLGWLNGGKIIVTHPTPLTLAQQDALAQGKHVYQETSLGFLDGVGEWAHRHLPPSPFEGS